MKLLHYTLTDTEGATLTETVDEKGATTAIGTPTGFGDGGPTASVLFTFDAGEFLTSGDFWRFLESELGMPLFVQHCARLTKSQFVEILDDFVDVDTDNEGEALDFWIEQVDVD